jgi:hypothetical protein
LFLTAATAVFALPVVVIELAFGALLMAFVGSPALLAPGIIAAGVAAIAVSAITVRADVEGRLALWMGTSSLQENCLAVSLRHALSQAGTLDNGTGFVAG